MAHSQMGNKTFFLKLQLISSRDEMIRSTRKYLETLSTHWNRSIMTWNNYGMAPDIWCWLIINILPWYSSKMHNKALSPTPRSLLFSPPHFLFFFLPPCLNSKENVWNESSVEKKSQDSEGKSLHLYLFSAKSENKWESTLTSSTDPLTSSTAGPLCSHF